MAFLLELKENLRKIFNKYDVYLVPAFKFAAAFISFCLLNLSIGYMDKLKNPLIALFLSVICAFLPSGFTIAILTVFMLIHLFAISIEFALIAFCVVIVMYLLYFRFAPKQGYLILLTVVFCAIKMPYMLPVAMGLGAGIFSIVPASFGVIIYYIIKTASAYEAAITNESASGSMQQISYIAETFLGNKDWLVLVLAFAVTIAIVYCIKRLSVDSAWTYAVIAGTVVQFLILITGIIVLDSKLNLVFVIIGTLAGALAGYVCQILLFSVDYKRTEFVQYEDDEYYYYVKAVPKINIAKEELKVKKINARNTKKTTSADDVRRNLHDSQAASLEQEDDFYI